MPEGKGQKNKTDSMKLCHNINVESVLACFLYLLLSYKKIHFSLCDHIKGMIMH